MMRPAGGGVGAVHPPPHRPSRPRGCPRRRRRPRCGHRPRCRRRPSCDGALTVAGVPATAVAPPTHAGGAAARARAVWPGGGDGHARGGGWGAEAAGGDAPAAVWAGRPNEAELFLWWGGGTLRRSAVRGGRAACGQREWEGGKGGEGTGRTQTAGWLGTRWPAGVTGPVDRVADLRRPARASVVLSADDGGSARLRGCRALTAARAGRAGRRVVTRVWMRSSSPAPGRCGDMYLAAREAGVAVELCTGKATAVMT